MKKDFAGCLRRLSGMSAFPACFLYLASPDGWRLRLRVALFVLCALLAGTVHAGKRVALVIGNEGYGRDARGEDLTLRTPGNDARAMAKALSAPDLGFALVGSKAHINLGQQAMTDLIERFRRESEGAEVALFYYAGHGIGGVSNPALPGDAADTWLQPVGSRVDSAADVRFATLSLSWLVQKMEDSGARARVLVIDACRNHPLYRGRGQAERGLSPVRTATGTLIAYAAGPGQTAADSHPAMPAHGLYTGELLNLLGTPGLELTQMFKRVGAAVSRQRSAQTPRVDDALYETLFLALGGGATPKEVSEERKETAPVKATEASPPAAEPVTVLSRLQTWLASAPTSGSTPSQSGTVPRPGEVFRDCEGCPEMVVLPAGNFEMGDLHGDGDSDEKPVRKVRIAQAFAMGKYEVTQGEWRALMGSSPSSFKQCGDRCPVEQVSWDEVQAFIRKLNAKTGKTYRLPSEAEWEYGCRAGGRHRYCGSDDLEAVAWYDENSGTTTHVVGGKGANRFGLYDMSGNAREWVQDCYEESGYDKGQPLDGRAHERGTNCARRVNRGGGWGNVTRLTRSAYRYWYSPGNRDNDLGFRLTRTLP